VLSPISRETPHGLLVLIELGPSTDRALEILWPQLHERERELASSWAPARRLTFAAGRRALRTALEALGVTTSGPILPNDRGAPQLPQGALASISHKGDVACALARIGGERTIGVDVENIQVLHRGTERLILTDRERAELPDELEQRAQRIVVQLSLKESIYKALDPFLRRYIGFKEVEVWPSDDQTARVELALPERDRTFDLDARWTIEQQRVISSVSAMVRPDR
jgi:4'-phosphopantetheinyl transferase EntD